MDTNEVSRSEVEADSKLDAEICLSVLIATKTLDANAEVKDANRYYISTSGGDCDNCKVKNLCYLFIKNE